MRTATWLATALIVETGLIHLFMAPHEYGDAPYLGFLFVANALLALASAFGIQRGIFSGWLLGDAVALGSLVGYVVSRTVGLPGMDAEPWLDPAGLVSLVAEGAFLTLAVASKPWASRGPKAVAVPLTARPALQGFAVPAMATVVVVLVSVCTYVLEQAALAGGG